MGYLSFFSPGILDPRVSPCLCLQLLTKDKKYRFLELHTYNKVSEIKVADLERKIIFLFLHKYLENWHYNIRFTTSLKYVN